MEIFRQQIGLQIHIPTKINNMTGTDRHNYLGELFQVIFTILIKP